MTIPRTAVDLTPEWISDALGRRVASVDAHPIAAGVGLVGALFRLSLDGDAGQETVIAKLAAPTDDARFVATVLNMYGREVGFYNELSPRTPVPHPACHYAVHDPATQDTVLLLEDVSSRGEGLDQLEGCDESVAGPAIRTLARLHAAFWDDVSLTDHGFLLRLCDDPYPVAVAMAYDAAWPRAQELFSEQLTPELVEFGDTYSARIPALFAKLCDGPFVLSHADWRLDNLFVNDDEVIAVDWQLVDRSVGPRDLSYFVTQSVNVDDDHGYERLFDAYLDALGGFGVQADRTWAWEMYRYGAMMAFVYPIIAAGALTIEDPRHVELTGGMLARSIAALEALDAFDLPL